MAQRRQRTQTSKYAFEERRTYIYGNTVRQAEAMPQRREDKREERRKKKNN